MGGLKNMENLKNTINLLQQFNLFHTYLMQNAPNDFIPWYFPITKNGKNPDAKAIMARGNSASWHKKHARLSYEEAGARIKAGGNVGLSGRSSDLLVPCDADTEEIYNQFKPGLKTKGRSRIGGHAWYFADPKDKRLPCNITTDQGEIRGYNQYILVPGCYVPCTKEELEKKVKKKEITKKEMEMAIADPALGYYTVEEKNIATTLTFEELPAIYKETQLENERLEVEQKVRPKQEYKPKQGNGRQSALFSLQITDLVNSQSYSSRFSHPIHDSDTGQNFSISNNLGHCWRHLVSLNALQFLVVKSGYMTCEQAGTGHKQGGGVSQVTGDNGAIFYAWLEAKKIGVIPQNDPIPLKAMWFIVTKHKLFPPKFCAFGKLPTHIYNKVLKIVEAEY